MHNLLIATVGGRPEPLVASILRWKPDRVVFVPSVGTKDQVPQIKGRLCQKGYVLGEGAYNMIPLLDPQDFSKCVLEMGSRLEQEVVTWRNLGNGRGCIVDFTGGTKCMTAALALVAQNWQGLQFSYVGGTKRDRNSVGVVVSDNEVVVQSTNPLEALGYQVVEDAVVAFDDHAFGEGARKLRNAMKRLQGKSPRKSELNALAMFMEAYDLWSRSEYGGAFERIERCEDRLNDLAESLLPLLRERTQMRRRMQSYIDQAKCRLSSLKEGSDHPTRALLEDLISDAARRRREDRHVDAVARLYRAVEATAQLRLWDKYKILTGKVALKGLPKPLRRRLEKQSEDGKTVKLALQDSYAFLIQKGDKLGKCFKSLGWDNQNSPLSRRNDSIAGHGFAPVSSEISETLWQGTLQLAELTEEQVFRFPQLGNRDE